jgi:hypothetical protein
MPGLDRLGDAARMGFGRILGGKDGVHGGHFEGLLRERKEDAGGWAETM